MKRLFLFLLLSPFLVGAATVEYSTTGVVSFYETTPAGDFTAIFKRCLVNDIFTFSRVNLNGRHVNSGMDSDNIGPFLIEGAAGMSHWVGGNHLDESGAPTAECLSVEISVDGSVINSAADFSGTCDVLTVKVLNRLFHSALGDVALERVTYTVSGNSIQVAVSHEFTGEAPRRIYAYYGMQSMFDGEDRILIPGLGGGWIDVRPGTDFRVTKSDVPDMSLFVESNGSAMQASLLYPDGMGDHHHLSDSKEVYIHSAIGKSYHVMIQGLTVTKGETINWKGMYSWFDKPVDDTFSAGNSSGCFVYPACEAGTDKYVIATGQSVTVIDPSSYSGLSRPGKDPVESPGVMYDIHGREISAGMSPAPGIYIVRDGEGIKKIRIF